MNSDFQTVVFCCFDDAGVDVVLVCLNIFDMLFQEPTSNAFLKREPSSQESLVWPEWNLVQKIKVHKN